MKPPCLTFILAGLTFFVRGPAGAQTRYTIQPIVKAGDRVGDFVIGGDFEVAGLNRLGLMSFFATDATGKVALIEYDHGRLTRIVKAGERVGNIPVNSFGPGRGPTRGGYTVFTAVESGHVTALFQDAAGVVTTVAALGGSAPGGQWASLDLPLDRPVSMNESGAILFSASVRGAGGLTSSSTAFRWDATTRQVAPIDVNGMPAGGSLTLLSSDRAFALNNRDEMLFTAHGTDAGGTVNTGLFLLDRSHKLRTIALSGQTLGGTPVGFFQDADLNDAGVVAFVAARDSGSSGAAYRWEADQIAATGVVEGADAPGGGKFFHIWRLWMDNRNDHVLAEANLSNDSYGPWRLYLYGIQKPQTAAVSLAETTAGLEEEEPPDDEDDDASHEKPVAEDKSSAEEHDDARPLALSSTQPSFMFLTYLKSGDTGAFVIDTDGNLSLFLKTGTSTSLGSIEDFPLPDNRHTTGFAFNSKGEAALPALFLTGTSYTEAILLLTPAAP